MGTGGHTWITFGASPWRAVALPRRASERGRDVSCYPQVLAAFDAGLLSSYKAVDSSALFTRQCIIADVLFLRKEVTKLHLALPKGVCPDLIDFAKSLDVSGG